MTHAAAGVTVVAVGGELDFSSASQLRLVLRTALAGTRRPYILIDLAELTFTDSTGLGLIICGLKGARARGGMLALAVVPPNTAALLRVAGLTRLLPAYDTVAAAQAALTAEAAA